MDAPLRLLPSSADVSSKNAAWIISLPLTGRGAGITPRNQTVGWNASKAPGVGNRALPRHRAGLAGSLQPAASAVVARDLAFLTGTQDADGTPFERSFCGHVYKSISAADKCRITPHARNVWRLFSACRCQRMQTGSADYERKRKAISKRVICPSSTLHRKRVSPRRASDSKREHQRWQSPTSAWFDSHGDKEKFPSLTVWIISC